MPINSYSLEVFLRIMLKGNLWHVNHRDSVNSNLERDQDKDNLSYYRHCLKPSITNAKPVNLADFNFAT